MKLQPIFLASPVYYDIGIFHSDAAVILRLLQGFDQTTVLTEPLFFMSQTEVDSIPGQQSGVTPVLIPMSGGTQKWVLAIAKSQKQSLMWMFYPNDPLFDAATQHVINRIVSKNALPSVIDTWAHLNNRGIKVELIYDKASFREKTRLLSGLAQIHASRLLVVGYTQQWVVSATVNQRKIEDKFGIQVTHIGLEELLAEFLSTERTEAVQAFATEYRRQALACLEPTIEQIEDAYRLYLALVSLLNRTGCNALAISCFSLVKSLGVTACLALSLLNDDCRFVAACEGDLDAAVSMIIGKSLTNLPVFMGNPVFNRNNTLDLVHCTSPRRLLGTDVQPYTVRSHHETGKSVAQRVEIASGTKATLFRIGNELDEATLYEATLVDNPDADTCRTQFRFAIDSTDKRLSEVLGCHQLVVFGEQEKLLREAFTKYMQIRVR